MLKLPVRLTSPLTHGHVVANAQRTLNGDNHFKQSFHAGHADGVFGEHTAAAVRRAKFHMGYRKRDINDEYGLKLRDYLHGRRKLTPLMKLRRKQRAKIVVKHRGMRQRALRIAASQIGQTENPPQSNRCKFSVWYGMIGPWCAMFQTWVWCEAMSRWERMLHRVWAGSFAFRRSVRYSYVPNVVADARAGRNGLSVTRNPIPGDLACFDWNLDGEADHIGLVEIPPNSSGSFTSIEGNTALGNDSNGGTVMRRSDRLIHEVQVFVRVGH